MYLLNPSAAVKMCYKASFFLSRVKPVWIQRFSFSLTGCLTKAKGNSLPNYLPITEKTDESMHFLMALSRREMQTASFRIWIRVTDSISHKDNYYIKWLGFIACQPL